MAQTALVVSVGLLYLTASGKLTLFQEADARSPQQALDVGGWTFLPA